MVAIGRAIGGFTRIAGIEYLCELRIVIESRRRWAVYLLGCSYSREVWDVLLQMLHLQNLVTPREEDDDENEMVATLQKACF